MLTIQDPTDANIASILAEKLQTWQYSQHPFDQEIASKFLDRYLDTLDYSHMYLLKSDLADFAPYRTNLPEPHDEGTRYQPVLEDFCPVHGPRRRTRHLRDQFAGNRKI